MSSEPLSLPPSLSRLYGALVLDTDTPIPVLVEAVGSWKPTGVPYDQQRLGSQITRLNRRIKGYKLRVVPGRLKRTYRLVSV